MGTPIEDPWEGGGGRIYLGEYLLGGGIGNTPFGFRNVGGEHTYGKDPGWVPPPGNNKDNGATPPATNLWELELTTARRRNDGGGAGDI